MIKLILLRLEKEQDPSLVLDFELYSIDHLEPRSSHISNVNKIGNLFLLEEEYNHNKENKKPFDIDDNSNKPVIEILKDKTKYKTTKTEFDKIQKSKTWTEKQIDDRTKELAIKTYNLFSKL